MLLQAIRQLNHAVPFRPYEIRTASGQRVVVPHPEFVFISPRGTWVMVTDEWDRPRHISSFLIEEVTPLGRRTRQVRRG